MNTSKLLLFKRLTVIFSLLFISHWAQANEDPKCINKSSDERQTIKIVDIPEGPSLFVVAGMSYLNQTAYCEVNVEVFHPGRMDYSLSSLKGEILFREHKRLSSGIDQVGISFANYPSGIYQLDLQLEQEQKTLIIEKTSENRLKASLVTHLK